MNSFDQTVGLQDIEHPALSRIDQRAIIARTENDAAAASQLCQKLFEEPVFADVSQFHWTSSGKARAVRVTALKTACIIIETRMEPLHS